MNTWQVTHTTCNGYIALVLDGTCLGTDSHSRVGILRIGHEWNEEDLHTILCHQTGKFRELHIIADHDTNLTTISIKGLDMATAAQAPALLLIRSYVNLLVHIHATISTAKETDIVEGIALEIRHTTGDDIDVVADGKFTESVTDLIGILSHHADALCLTQIVESRHQWRIEILWEEDEIALIVAHGIHEELYLLKKVVHRSVWTHLPLYQTDSHGWLSIYIGIRRWLIVDVIPLQEGCAVFALLITRKIVADDTANVEVVGKLEGKNRVIDFTVSYVLDVLLRAHLVGILMIVWNTTTKHDRLQVELLAEFLAILIHTASQSEATIIRVDKYLNTIKDVSIRIVGIEGFITCHLSIGMVAFHHIIVDDDRERTAHNLIIHDDNHLSLRKDSNEFLNLFFCPEYI